MDEQTNISAYNELGDKIPCKSHTPYSTLLGWRVFRIISSIEATEQRFGAFHSELQYIRYGNKVYKADEWDEADSFPKADRKFKNYSTEST